MMGADQRELQVRSRINRPEQEVTAEWQFPERTGSPDAFVFHSRVRQQAVCMGRAHRWALTRSCLEGLSGDCPGTGVAKLASPLDNRLVPSRLP